jgi:hypothetical protein
MAETITQPPLQDPLERPRPAVRAKRSLATRLGQSIRAWVRNTFEKEQLIAGLKSLAWVAPMTVIIWVYAEREQTSKQPVQFRIEPRNNDKDRLVEILGPGADGKLSAIFTVRADLAGPNKGVEQEKEKLEGGGGLQIEIPESLGPGDHQIPLASLLVNDPTFEKEGLTPSGILPAQVTVHIDEIRQDDATVVARSTVTNLDGPPRFTPATIAVVGPKTALDAARHDGRLVAYAELPPLTDPGQKTISNVPITVPINDPHIRLSTSAVSALVTVKDPTVEGTLQGVPILAAYPPGDLWDKNKATYETTLSDLKVNGPADIIEDVKKPDSMNKPKVFLDLSGGHVPNPPVPGQHYTAPLVYEFGNTGLKPGASAPKTLEFTVEPRKPDI